MNERKRFEEWAKEKGYNVTCSDMGPDRILNGLMFYDNIRVRDKQEGWQAHAKTAGKFEELVPEILKWQRDTFPNGNVMSIMKHLVTEIIELYEAIENSHPLDEVAKEIADCEILLIGLAGKLSIDIPREIEKKHRINMARERGKPTEDGIIEHI